MQNFHNGLWIDGGTNINLDACQIWANSLQGADLHQGVLFSPGVSEWAIRNCNIGDIYVGPETQEYAIFLTAGIGDNFMITNNDVRGNSTGAIAGTTYAATRIVRDNLGFVCENSGTDTIASGNTTKTVTHGMAAAPTVVNIAFREQGTNDFGRWWVSAIGATTFVLNVSADPGASNLDFAWEAKLR